MDLPGCPQDIMQRFAPVLGFVDANSCMMLTNHSRMVGMDDLPRVESTPGRSHNHASNLGTANVSAITGDYDSHSPRLALADHLGKALKVLSQPSWQYGHACSFYLDGLVGELQTLLLPDAGLKIVPKRLTVSQCQVGIAPLVDFQSSQIDFKEKKDPQLSAPISACGYSYTDLRLFTIMFENDDKEIQCSMDQT